MLMKTHVCPSLFCVHLHLVSMTQIHISAQRVRDGFIEARCVPTSSLIIFPRRIPQPDHNTFPGITEEGKKVNRVGQSGNMPERSTGEFNGIDSQVESGIKLNGIE